MKIKSFYIKNFKSLYDFPASKFGNINMIFGLNNSGKSNMLKFLSLVFQSKTYGQQVKVNSEENRRQVTNLTNFWEGEVSNLPYIFFNNNIDSPIEFDITLELNNNEIPLIEELKEEKITIPNKDYSNIFINGQFVATNKTTSRIELKEVQMNNKVIFQEGDYFPGYNNLSQEQFYFILKELNDCVLFLDSNRIPTNDSLNTKEMPNNEDINYSNYLKPDLFKDSLFSLYLYEYENFMSLLSSIGSFKVKDQGIEILKQHLLNSPLEKPEIGFTKFNNKYELMLKNGKGNRYPLINYGSGIQQLIYILINIFSSSSKIILIEELELNLSPLYQLELIKFINDEIDKATINQFFFTTHSKYFYDRTDLITLFEVTINELGHSKIRKANKTRLNNYFKNNYY